MSGPAGAAHLSDMSVTCAPATVPSTYPYPGMPDVVATIIDSATGRDGLLAARFRNGHITHVINDNLEWRAAMGLGRLIIYTRPLCHRDPFGSILASKRRGMVPTMMIVGGHVTPTEPTVALAAALSPCPTCSRRLADLNFDVG